MSTFFKRDDLLQSTLTNEVYRCVKVEQHQYTFIGDDSGTMQVPQQNVNAAFFRKFRLVSPADLVQKGGAR